MSPADCSCKATSCFMTHTCHKATGHLIYTHWYHGNTATCVQPSQVLNGWERSINCKGHTHSTTRQVTLPISAVLCVPTAMGENKKYPLITVIVIIKLRASTLPTSVHHSTAASILQPQYTSSDPLHQYYYVCPFCHKINVPYNCPCQAPWYTHVWQKNNL